MLSKRWATLFALVIVLSMILAACAPAAEPEVVEVEKVVTEVVTVKETVVVEAPAAPEEEKVFVFCRYGDAINPDPVMNDANYDLWYMQQYYSGLTRIANDGSLEFDLAESMEVSDDGLTYTFYLRPDLKWSDGTPITPEDWEWTFERAANPDNGIWWFTLEAMESVVADEEKVVFTLSEPYVPFQYTPALFNTVVMPKDKVEAAGGWEAFMEQPIGAGPYIMTEWIRGDTMTLVKNPYFWDEGKPVLDKIILKTITEDNTRILALQAGDCDAINYPPFNRADELAADPNLVVHKFPGTYTKFITPNNRIPPFDDVRVRQALSHAIDRQAIINVVNFGVGEPATTWRPRGSLYYNYDLEGWPYDLEKAGAMLDEAGWKDEDGDGMREAHGVAGVEDGTPFAAVMTIREGREADLQIVTMLKEMWANIGFDIEIVIEEQGLHSDNYYNNNFEISPSGWTDDIPDPSQSVNYAVVNKTSESYHTGFQSDEVDQLAADALRETDPVKREQMYHRIQEIFNEETPFIPTHHEPYLVITRTGVKGFYQTPLGIYLWRGLDVVR